MKKHFVVDLGDSDYLKELLEYHNIKYSTPLDWYKEFSISRKDYNFLKLAEERISFPEGDILSLIRRKFNE